MNTLRGFVKIIPGLLIETGYGNGYVVIPKGHPTHGIDYDDIAVEVHGGLTFSALADGLAWPEIKDIDKGGWVVGFDTAHLGDSLVRWPDEKSVMVEVDSLKRQLIATGE